MADKAAKPTTLHTAMRTRRGGCNNQRKEKRKATPEARCASSIRKLDATPVFREVLGPALTSFTSQLPYSRMRYNLLRATVLQALTTYQ
jgi:hypothetical protein